jgi:hypothetical protein
MVDNEAKFLIGVQPPRFNQGPDESARLAIPLHPGFDGIVCVLADVAPRRESCGEVPHTLQIAQRGTFRQSEQGSQVRKFGMIWNRTESHLTSPSATLAK